MTFELNKSTGMFIEQYMDRHTGTMLILIEKMRNDEYNVIYANSLATDYFLSNTSMSGEHFFHEDWNVIVEELKKIMTDQAHHTVIKLQKNQLFELDLLSNETDIIFIEMREQEVSMHVEENNDFRIKYETLIENNLDTIITLDLTGVILHTNLAIESVFGFQKDQLVNESIYPFIQSDQIELVKLMIKDAGKGISSELTEVNISHSDKLFLPALVKILPVSNDDLITELTIIFRDLSKYYAYNEKFLFLSFRDQLTGLFNRKSLKKDFAENRKVAQANKEKMSIVHIGLDRFKLMNEALGHSGADEILKSVSKRIVAISPTSYKVYRNSGDEFIIIINSHTVGKTEEMARLIVRDFQNPFYFNNAEYYISASIGIAVYPDDGKSIEKLIQNSEQAMFYVKENGRSHFRFYAKEMKALMSDEVFLESHLRRAIELDEFRVYYQPQIDLATGDINSFEALLRWNNGKFGFVSPADFIQIAEDSGLIHGIGEWVLNQVCLQLKEWQKQSYREVSIAVNISPKQFRMSGFSKKVEEIIEKHQIKPCLLELEITESSLENMDETLLTLNELKVIGVSISVDDFGTGYSSLSYLKQYPIDTIKIDQSFIKDIESDEKNEAIAKTIINLAHNLGMDVIAEGVEKQLQANILLKANCQKAQGFLYSKALPVDEIIEKYFAPMHTIEEKEH